MELPEARKLAGARGAQRRRAQWLRYRPARSGLSTPFVRKLSCSWEKSFSPTFPRLSQPWRRTQATILRRSPQPRWVENFGSQGWRSGFRAQQCGRDACAPAAAPGGSARFCVEAGKVAGLRRDEPVARDGFGCGIFACGHRRANRLEGLRPGGCGLQDGPVKRRRATGPRH